MEMPTTTEELREVLRAFKDKDPNGNGTKDEIPLTCRLDFLKNIAAPFGTNVLYGGNYIVDSAGKITDTRTTAQYKDYLTYINKL
jgi:putative aldouronate transport system substrate-binding protein